MKTRYSKVFHVIVLSILIFPSIKLNAQAFTATYAYDGNGNRYTANVIFLTTTIKSAKIDSTEKDSVKPVVTDSISNIQISIYPNPTHRTVLINIKGMQLMSSQNSNGEICLWELNGRKIITSQIINENTSIDMSNLPNGIYILNVSINGCIKNYKVIKN